jgi:hypothetical protein
MREDDDLDIPVDVVTDEAATPVPLAVALLGGTAPGAAKGDPRLAFLEGLLHQVRERRRARR